MLKQLLSTLVLPSLIVLAGCASQSVYAPASRDGGTGYEETRLGDDRYRITFNGNSRTSKDTVKDYALLRAAELTLQNGNDWFYVVTRETDVETRDAPGASAGFERERVVDRSCGLLGCSETRRIGTGFEGGTERTRTQYSHSLEIRMGEGELPEGRDAYEAATLARELRAAM